jgi:predicted nuclease with TOPRIM domain
MNSMISLNDKSIDKCKEYTNAMKNNVIEFIENKLKAFEEDRLKYKADMYNYNLKNEQKFNDLKNKIKELKRGFDEFNEKYNQKMDEIYNINNMFNEKIEKNIQSIRNNKLEIDILKNDIKAINENIKNFSKNFSNNCNSH